VAGCGAQKATTQTIRGAGFSFQSPADWTFGQSGDSWSASLGSVNRVEVLALALVKAYDPARFAAATKELDQVAASLAGQLHGKVTGRSTVQAGGRSSRSYRIAYGDKIQQITFVLDGKHEFELLCRRAAAASDAGCALLLTSFALD